MDAQMKLSAWQGLRERPGFWLAALLLAAALLLGGSSTRPIWMMIVELLALIVLSYFAVSRRYRSAPGGWIPLAIIALMLLVPLIQLVPLPWAMWAALPGHGLAAEILTLAGLQGRAMPASLEPQSTVSSALALLPGAAMLVAALMLDTRDRRGLVLVLLGGAAFSLVLGAFQYATRGQGTLFETGHIGFPIGLFSNRNQQADLMLLALVIAAALVAPYFWRRAQTADASGRRWISAGVLAVFAIATIATTSRMGVLLLPLAVLMAALQLVKVKGRRAVIGIAATLAVAAIALPILSQNPVVAKVLARFSSSDEDGRYLFWIDTVFGIPQFTPVGSGVGSFETVYKTLESLDHVGPGVVNAAHNEYLQLALEGGYPAGVLFLTFLGFIVWAAVRLVRSGSAREEVIIGRAALAGIALILLHSIVDYPLRMPSLAAAFGLLCGLLLLRRRDTEARPG